MFIRIFLILVSLGVSVAPLQGRRLHDFARVLPLEASSEIESSLISVERDTTAQLVVVTVKSLEEKEIDQYARELFNQWGIGRKDLNNGILFLIAPEQRRVRIEVGFGLEGLFTDSLSGEILDRQVVPYFKNGQQAEGIRAGVDEIIRLLRAYPEAAKGVAGSAPGYVFTPFRNARNLGYVGIGAAIVAVIAASFARKRKRYSPLLFFIVVASLLALAVGLYSLLRALNHHSLPIEATVGSYSLGLGALIYNLRRYLRYRPHKCKSCGTEMRLLNESEDDPHLKPEEKLEESIASIDYDVFVCPACLKNHKVAYREFLSSFRQCKKCKRKAFSETSKVITPATRYSSGIKEVNGECRNCWYETSRRVIIPAIRKSSSSGSSGFGGGGSGGFGGGSSGGGGASRGW